MISLAVDAAEQGKVLYEKKDRKEIRGVPNYKEDDECPIDDFHSEDDDDWDDRQLRRQSR